MRTGLLAIAVLLSPVVDSARAANETANHAGRPLAHWIGLLKDENSLLREEAAAVLSEMGEQARDALPVLRPLLKSNDARLRLRAAVAVWKIERQGKDVLPVLTEFLRDTD